MNQNFVPSIFLAALAALGLVIVATTPLSTPGNPPPAPSPQPPTQTGILVGTMTIGPICPVERPDHPCLPTPEMFAAHKVYVYTARLKTFIATITPNASGTFAISLSVGDYLVDMEHQGIGAINGVPQTVHIEAGKTTEIKIDVDTGIR